MSFATAALLTRAPRLHAVAGSTSRISASGHCGGQSRPSAGEQLVGEVVRFDEWSEHPVKLSQKIREAARTNCSQAYTLLRPGAFDEHLSAARRGESRIELRIDHDRAFRLCSTSRRVLELFADESALTFRVRSDSERGRKAIQWARAVQLHEVSPGYFPTLFEWQEPHSPGSPGRMVIDTAILLEVSLVKYGSFGRTYSAIV